MTHVAKFFALVCVGVAFFAVALGREVPTQSVNHIPTGDFLGGVFGTHSIKWSQAAPYLTWAMTDKHDANAIAAAGIKTIFYSDPDRTLPGGPMYSQDESTFAHACSG